MILKTRYLHFAFICTTLLFVACAPSRVVRPLEKGQKQVNAHLGGPLIGFAGTTIPIPFTSLTYAQGLRKNTTVYGSVHTTSLMFGVFQTDIGACQNLYYNDSLKLGFSASPALNLAFDKWEKNFRCWPQLDVNAYWELKAKKSFVYAGVENWFELSSYKAHQQKQQTHVLINPQIGFTYCRTKWNYNTELKYLAPGKVNTPNIVDYKGIGGKGAIGFYLSVSRKF
jgi:hypothetical protein